MNASHTTRKRAALLGAHLWPLTAAIDEGGRLIIGGCNVAELARQYGTPLYLFDEVTIRESCRTWCAALTAGYQGETAVHYASKALLNSALARLIADEGLGLDVVSGGELYVALHAGFPPQRIYMHGNAKTRAELEQALSAEIGQIIVDNLDELEILANLTLYRLRPQPVALRIAPDIAADTHAHMQTGHATSKFGLPLDALDAAAERLRTAPGLRLLGLHAHLGSQLFDLDPYAAEIEVLLDTAARLRDRYGLTIQEINAGGGMGVPYTADQKPFDPYACAARLGEALTCRCRERGFPLPRLVIEPGRSIIARAGVALYTIVATKNLPHTRFLHIDGGMGDNIRPALYGARYTAVLAEQANAPAEEIVEIAGRYCESGDVLIHAAPLPRARVGDILAVPVAGAYTLSMASTYNLTPRPAVVMVNSGNVRLIQRRETYEDLIARDARDET
ncbi:MAG: diaminopimelate decarboxylase [Roseiflexus sp.]|nr:diaminopimelate decarboxylase [Roseiflexus sp.]MCS7290219.1 diaminopimelate decarboxylase [Roseiflexus sp.]MDW8146613.1 diaminopimelate decarboxylase [Roseiflexaceae bacterium]MDW8233619.1 diaminopimelate decarboxylase [Roseiflexaceae bacterium]